jgi:hypothetical protein
MGEQTRAEVRASLLNYLDTDTIWSVVICPTVVTKLYICV